MTTLSFPSRRGSALVTVMMLSLGLLMIIASILTYSFNERRLNHRAALRLEARNAAEAVSEYGMAQVRALMDARRDYTGTRFTQGADKGSVATLPLSYWSGSRVVTAGAAVPELVVGLQRQIPLEGLYYYDPKDPNNAYDTMLLGRYALRFDLEILSKATVQPLSTLAGGPQTVYMTQTLSARAVPLFSHAMFYNMDLELWPGPAMDILGGVHTNGNLWVKKQSTNGTTLNFIGPVTVAGEGHALPPAGIFRGAPDYPSGFYAGVKCPVRTPNGASDNLSGYTDATFFTTAAGGLVSIKDTSRSPVRWRDQLWGEDEESAETQESFRLWATQNCGGNLQTRLHDVQVSNLPGIGSYREDPTPNDNIDDTINTARRLIEVPLRQTDTYPDNTGGAYSAEIESQKYSTQSGLYITVNPSASERFGRKPNGTLILIKPGKYRVFAGDGTELLLPGQLDWGDRNLNKNRSLNQPTGGVLDDQYIGGRPIVTVRPGAMIDLRRARRTDGGAFNWNSSRSSANAYNPLAIDTIDVDLRELKLAVDRTINRLDATTGYLTDTPPDGRTTNDRADSWRCFIYNPAATTKNIALTDRNLIFVPDPNNPSDPTKNIVWNGRGWNGAIYIESVEADYASPSTVQPAGSSRATLTAANRANASGVRLINGRGRIASALSGPNQGLTIATNDALYLLGHFNADGAINTATIGTSNSGRYNEPGEVPASVVGDSLTILSAPAFALSGSGASLKVTQTMGWNDATSGHTPGTSSYSSSWMTSNPSGSNRLEGVNTTVNLYRLPYSKNNSVGFSDATSVQTLTTSRDTKCGGNSTEISSAFLVGIVISNKDGNGQNSGGANNYPRFTEDFSTGGPQSTVAIRGSIVCMFESRVATEPWNWRTFDAPSRLWGFNELFRQGKFPPLTPMSMYYRRVDFNDITPAQYTARKTAWGL